MLLELAGICGDKHRTVLFSIINFGSVISDYNPYFSQLNPVVKHLFFDPCSSSFPILYVRCTAIQTLPFVKTYDC
jgi:hypothetical protein